MSRLAQRWLQILTVPIAFGVAAAAHAAEFCVTNSQELQAALTTAASNGEDDVIRLQTGTYSTPAGGFKYDGAVPGGDDKALLLIGGWSPFFDNPCGQILVDDPYQTQLNGEGKHRVMQIFTGTAGDITVRLLTFRAGKPAEWFQSNSGLNVEAPDGGTGIYSGNVSIEHNAFIYNESGHGSGLHITAFRLTGGAKVRIINNLFARNGSAGSCPAGSLFLTLHPHAPLGTSLHVINNTVADNQPGISGQGIFCVHGASFLEYKGLGAVRIFNNNLWGNDGADLEVFLDEGSSYHLLNNNIHQRAGSAPTEASGNLDIEPVYEPCRLHPPLLCLLIPPTYVPRFDSRMVDAGRHPLTGETWWVLPQYDLKGLPREDAAGTRVDIGAYESHARIFADRFEQ